MRNIKQTYRHARRAKEIVTILAKYGFGYLLDLTAISNFLKIREKLIPRKGKEEKIKRLTAPERARLALEELGPTFIKIGQILSVRPDLIPPEFAQEFSRLQDDVPPFSFTEVAEQIKNELGKGINELFIKFEKRSIAAASLSQVHKASLDNDRVVAVKIQRPNIRHIIETDIAILYDLAKFIEKRWTATQLYQPAEVIKELSRAIINELNFTAEAHSIDTFRKNFSQTDYIHIPKVYWDLTTEKILTMEFVEGVKLSEVMKSSQDNRFDKKLIANRGVEAMLKQIFEDKFFHGDPHPGNIFILPDNHLAFLDFGIAGRLDEQTVSGMADLLIAVTQNDIDKMIKGWGELDIIDITADVKTLKSEVKTLMDKYYGLPLKELHVGEVMQEMFAVIARHHIKIPVDLTLLGKAMVTIEGVGQELNPDFNMAAQVKPFARKLIKRKYSPETLLKRGTNLTKELIQILEKVPHEFYWLIKSLRQGDLAISIKHKELDEIINVINRASNRLSFALIIAALIVGSSLIINFSQGPFVFGYPVLGIFGFLIAAVFGLGLIISIIRKGKL